MKPTESGRHRFLTGLTIAACIAIWGASWWVERDERAIPVEITCGGERCHARIGDAMLATDRVRDAAEARSIGLYVYHPHEFDRPQYFRELSLESATLPGKRKELPLLDSDWRSDALTAGSWSVRPGRGVTHSGELGERAIAILERFEAADFTVRVVLDSAVDAGVIVRAVDERNGTVLVVRPRYNDAFFFDLARGEPGPIDQFTALRPLRTGREALRLAGLVARLILVGLVAFVVFRGLASLMIRPLPIPRWFGKDRTPRFLVAVLALLATIALAAVATLGLDGVPHVADETAYLFQAKIFAGGAAWVQSPAPADFFRHDHMVIEGGRWYAKYPPLFSLLLAAGVLTGLPWLINPLLGALALVGIFFLTRELAGWRWALGAALLTLSSPFFVVMGGTLMSHMTAATLVTWMLYFVVRGLNREQPLCGVAAGVCLGLTVFTRPFTALLVGLAVGIHGVTRLRQHCDRRRILAFGLLFAAATLPFAGGYLAWNGYQTSADGDFSFGNYGAYDSADTLGFGADKGRGWLKTWGTWGHTPAKALRSVEQFLEYTSHHLLGWPLQLSFALIVGAFVVRSRTGFEGLLLAVFLSLVAGHTFYWATQHIAYGARYWFSATPGLMVLAALGLRGATRSGDGDDSSPKPGAWCAHAAVALLMVWNLFVYLPDRFAELPDYAGVSADLKRAIDRQAMERGIVFIETEGLIYNDGFFMNDPFGRDTRIFVRDLGTRNREIFERYPDHPAYRWSQGRLIPLDRAARATLQAGQAGVATSTREQP